MEVIKERKKLWKLWYEKLKKWERNTGERR
jgi:hypothetical protein